MILWILNMKGWSVVDILALACLLLAIGTSRCDNPGKSAEKTAKAVAVAHGSNSTANKTNVANSTVHVNSTGISTTREKSPGSVSPVASSKKPPVQVVPKVPSAQAAHSLDASKKQNRTGSLGEKDVLNWTEGGGVRPNHHQKDLELSFGSPKSNGQGSGEDVESSSLKPHKNIIARKGVVLPTPLPGSDGVHPVLPALNSSHPHPQVPQSTSTTTSTSPPVTHPRKLKPHFTMVRGDKFTSGSESILESPTTGRDYIFPLVLLIFAVPGTVFLIKFLYKRGTEFTERQQYHRMYLIDDDFKKSALERWKRAFTFFIFGENCQTVNLTSLGDSSLKPTTSYNSF